MMNIAVACLLTFCFAVPGIPATINRAEKVYKKTAKLCSSIVQKFDSDAKPSQYEENIGKGE